MPATAAAATAAAGAGTAAAFPWSLIAMGGSAILEAIMASLFGPSKEMRRATKAAAGKASELIAKPGYDQNVLDSIFGKNFENIRGQARTMGAQREETFSRAGMSGTGAAIKAARSDAWSNENLVTEAMRDLLITGEAKKQASYQSAASLLGAATGASAQQQGQGPALTEMVMTALLLGKMGKKPAVTPDEIPTLGGNYGGWQGMFDNYSQAQSRTGGAGFLPYNWLTMKT